MASLWREETDMRYPLLVALAAVAFVASVIPARAQDAIKADPKHYKVEFENDQVRVLRITYAPGEKSVIHEHPASVAVFMTDAHVRFTSADGKTEEANQKAGSTMMNTATKHVPENVGKAPFEVILVELKGKPASPK
jgi:quercetin dioxygenase-like cupin family protein